VQIPENLSAKARALRTTALAGPDRRTKIALLAVALNIPLVRTIFAINVSSFLPGEQTTQVMPRVDIVKRDDELVVKAELPGVDKKDLDVSMTENAETLFDRLIRRMA